MSAIVPGGQQSAIVLGVNFLRRYFSVFKWDATDGTGSVGLATARLAQGSLQTSNASSAATSLSVDATQQNRLALLLDVRDGTTATTSEMPSVHQILGRRLLGW